MKKINIHTQKNKGFTLVETLVSLALFCVVLVIATGVIGSVIDINKRNQAISSVVNNLNYSIDSMIRDIKTGYLYKCDVSYSTISEMKDATAKDEGECTESLTLISTIAENEAVVKYTFVSPTDGNGYIEKTIYAGNVGNIYGITDRTNVDIKNLNFVVTNPDSLDNADVDSAAGQPSVFVVIKGIAGSAEVEASQFFVQTFISQRLLNLSDFKD